MILSEKTDARKPKSIGFFEHGCSSHPTSLFVVNQNFRAVNRIFRKNRETENFGGEFGKSAPKQRQKERNGGAERDF